MGAFATFRDDVKYVIVMRNPEEAIVSFKPFIEAHNPKLWELWGASEMRDKFVKPTFQPSPHLSLYLATSPHTSPYLAGSSSPPSSSSSTSACCLASPTCRRRRCRQVGC